MTVAVPGPMGKIVGPLLPVSVTTLMARSPTGVMPIGDCGIAVIRAPNVPYHRNDFAKPESTERHWAIVHLALKQLG